MDSHTYAYVKCLLERWGEWCEAHLEDHGLPTVNVIEHFGEGGGLIPGHRILCREMPRKIWATNYHVIHQPEQYREALTAWYVFHVKPDGTRWTAREKAGKLGIGYDLLRQRVSRGRRALCRTWLVTC